MNMACPQCERVYRIDPARVPAGGVVTRCRECSAHFRFEVQPALPGVVHTGTLVAAPAPSNDAAPTAPATGPPPAAPQPGKAAAFGSLDPETRARRLARALVSDIVMYHPEKLQRSRSAGTLRKDFREEILKSWEEFVQQVGEETAKRKPYFRDALNDILADGERVF